MIHSYQYIYPSLASIFGGGSAPVTGGLQWLQGLNSGLVINDIISPLVVTPEPEVQDTATLKFDGVGDRIQMVNLDFDAGTGDFTIDCWIYISSAGSGNRVILAKYDTVSSKRSFFLKMDNNNNYGLFTSGDGTAVSSITASLHNPTTDTWHHLVVVKTGTTATFTEDDVLLGNLVGATSATLFHDATVPVMIGCLRLDTADSGSDTQFFNGEMGQFVLTVDNENLICPIPLEETEGSVVWDTCAPSQIGNIVTTSGVAVMRTGKGDIPSYNNKFGFRRV